MPRVLVAAPSTLHPTQTGAQKPTADAQGRARGFLKDPHSGQERATVPRLALLSAAAGGRGDRAERERVKVGKGLATGDCDQWRQKINCTYGTR